MLIIPYLKYVTPAQFFCNCLQIGFLRVVGVTSTWTKFTSSSWTVSANSSGMFMFLSSLTPLRCVQLTIIDRLRTKPSYQSLTLRHKGGEPATLGAAPTKMHFEAWRHGAARWLRTCQPLSSVPVCKQLRPPAPHRTSSSSYHHHTCHYSTLYLALAISLWVIYPRRCL